MPTATFKNVSDGPRGVHDVKGNLVMIDAGKSAKVEVNDGELNDAKAGNWFDVGGKAAAEVEETPTPENEFDADVFTNRTLAEITDEELAALTPDQRATVRAAEEDREQPRKGLLDRLDELDAKAD